AAAARRRFSCSPPPEAPPGLPIVPATAPTAEPHLQVGPASVLSSLWRCAPAPEGRWEYAAPAKAHDGHTTPRAPCSDHGRIAARQRTRNTSVSAPRNANTRLPRLKSVNQKVLGSSSATRSPPRKAPRMPTPRSPASPNPVPCTSRSASQPAAAPTRIHPRIVSRLHSPHYPLAPRSTG